MVFSQTFGNSTYPGEHRDPTLMDKLLLACISSIINHPDYVSDNVWPHPLHRYLWDKNLPWPYCPHCPGMDLLVNTCVFTVSAAMLHYKLQWWVEGNLNSDEGIGCSDQRSIVTIGNKDAHLCGSRYCPRVWAIPPCFWSRSKWEQVSTLSYCMGEEADNILL